MIILHLNFLLKKNASGWPALQQQKNDSPSLEAPHSLPWRQWILSFLDIVHMELSTARIHGVGKGTVRAWGSASFYQDLTEQTFTCC